MRRTPSPMYNTSGDAQCICRPSWTTSPPCCHSTAPTIASRPEERPMTLENNLLEKLNDWRPDSARSTLTVAGGAGQHVVLTADRNDDLATRVWDLTLNRGAVPDLKGWAEKFCDRTTGLLEPLKLI